MTQSEIRREESFHDDYVKRHAMTQKVGTYGLPLIALAVAVVLIIVGAVDVLVKLLLAIVGVGLMFAVGVLGLGVVIFFIFTAAAGTKKSTPRTDEWDWPAWVKSSAWDPVRRVGYSLGLIQTVPSRMGKVYRYHESRPKA